MKPSSIRIAALLSGLLVGVSPALGHAQTSERKAAEIQSVAGDGSSYRVEFDDDPLDALGHGENIARIRVRQPMLRVLLIRPRASFVTEMQKSVEAL